MKNSGEALAALCSNGSRQRCWRSSGSPQRSKSCSPSSERSSSQAERQADRNFFHRWNRPSPPPPPPPPPPSQLSAAHPLSPFTPVNHQSLEDRALCLAIRLRSDQRDGISPHRTDGALLARSGLPVSVIAGCHELLRTDEERLLESGFAAPGRHDSIVRLVLQGSRIEAGRLGLRPTCRRTSCYDRDRGAA